jgi:DNA-binding SARP family transcriptional activator/tetratricopeptide (TPR) repeat protein
MVRLDLSLLGGFLAQLDGQTLARFKSDKTRALLAYLAAEADRPHRREKLAALLWPERPESAARSNLSQAVYNLRSILGERTRPEARERGHRPPDGASVGAPPRGRPALGPFLLVNGGAVQFNPASDHRVDATTFTSFLQACVEHGHRTGEECDACLQRLIEAVAVYRGPFLQGLTIPDSVPFEEWATTRREQLHRQAQEALQRLAAAHERRGEYEQGLVYAWRQVELDPWHEEAQRQLMRLLAVSGQRGAALAQYEACRRVLIEELGTEPAPDTAALYERIRSGALAAPTHPEPTVRELPLPASDEISEPPRPLFVARQKELAQLDAWLKVALDGRGRVGFVLGDPGSGKTMLLREFARRAVGAHPELVMAGGTCDAYTGGGDPYLPFRQILEMLAGDMEGRGAAGALSRESARRLRALLPAMVQALLDEGPELINLLLSGEGLLARLPEGAPGWARLGELQHKAPGGLAQAALLEQVARVLQALARQHPLLLLLDDLQWADTGSVSLLFHLARWLASDRAGPDLRILVLGAYRPEEVASGRDGGRHPLEPVLGELGRLWGDIVLDLALADGRRLVEGMVSSEPNHLGTRFRDILYHHTGGHALFTAELLQSLREGGGLQRDADGHWVEGAGLDWGRLPARVEATIEERIGRLSSEEREMLTVASVEGEEFHAEVLARVQGLEEGAVIRLLSGALSRQHHLVIATALEKAGAYGHTPLLSRYRFRHYLFQHYLYGRLDAVERAHLHGQVGLALEALYGPYPSIGSLAELVDFFSAPSQVDVLGDKLTSPRWAATPRLARHFVAGGMTVKALAYLWYAASRGAMLESFEQALSYVNHFLALTATLPDTAEKLLLEYTAQGMLGTVYLFSKSMVAPELQRVNRRRYELAQRLGRPRLLADALTGMAGDAMLNGDVRTAREHSQCALDIIREHDPARLEEYERGQCEGGLYLLLLHGGELTEFCRQFEPLYAPLLSAPPQLKSSPTEYDLDVLRHAPWALWALGYPERALRVGRATLAMAQASKDPVCVACVLFDGICFLHQFRREVEPAEQALQELIPLAKQLARPFITAHTTLFQGWVQAQSEDNEEGIETLRLGLEQWAQNHLVLLPYWKGFLAEALARAGRVGEGLALLEEARDQAERGGEGWSLPEVYRLKGELLLQKGMPSSPALLPCTAWEKGEEETVAAASCRAEKDAEACFRQAVGVAQRQEAKSWELRATTSLARLLRAEGRTAEGREMLASIYGWFTEGFDTPDLREAKALLEELG